METTQQIQTTADGLVDTRTAANLLGIAAQTLESWRSTGRGPQIPTVKMSKRCLCYRLSDLRKFIADGPTA